MVSFAASGVPDSHSNHAMTIIDDPLLALILRFVTPEEAIEARDEAFIQAQIETLRRHLARYPEEQRGEQALRWIEGHAANYRRTWQRRTAAEGAERIRCGDCPLSDEGDNRTCEIHGAWLDLLNGFVAGAIDSRAYVERTLGLLREHKQRLRLPPGRRVLAADAT